MNEIKFRGKKTSTKEWIYGSLISDNNGGFAIVQIMDNPIKNGEVTGWCFGVIPETVGQFTGRTDKNKKDIFKGDKNQDGGVVVWNQDDASFCWEYENVDTHLMGDENEWCEIVGNIHEQKIKTNEQQQ